MNGHRSRTAGVKRRSLLIVLAVVSVLLLFGLYHIASDFERNQTAQETTASDVSNLTATSDATTVSEKDGENDDFSEDDTGRMTWYNDSWYQKKNYLETLLVIGLDKDEEYTEQQSAYQNALQSDFLLLLIFDRKNNTVSALHINRDTMVEIWQLDVTGKAVDTFTGQLALSHTYGETEAIRCQYTVRAVSKFLYGINIDHYISFTLDAVPILNDLCGGVTLKLADDFSEMYEGFTEGAEVTLQGEQALSYVQARGSLADSTNLKRMERQRQYMDALLKTAREKAAQDGEGSFAKVVLSNLNDYLYSDCTLIQLSRLADTALKDAYTGMEDVTGEAVKGETYMEFYADEAELQEQIIRLFYDPVK